MTTASTNWIHQKNPEPSINDKIMALLDIKSKLVLVQLHEVERIKKLQKRERHYTFVTALYNHYIVNGGDKTYNLNKNVG